MEGGEGGGERRVRKKERGVGGERGRVPLALILQFDHCSYGTLIGSHGCRIERYHF